MLCCAVLCCGVLCCGVLCCGVLWCCTVLCCAVLCCAVPTQVPPNSEVISEKQHFDDTFSPFYRVEQVILKLANPKPGDSILAPKYLARARDLQQRVAAIWVEEGGYNVTWAHDNDNGVNATGLCFRPIPGKVRRHLLRTYVCRYIHCLRTSVVTFNTFITLFVSFRFPCPPAFLPSLSPTLPLSPPLPPPPQHTHAHTHIHVHTHTRALTRCSLLASLR